MKNKNYFWKKLDFSKYRICSYLLIMANCLSVSCNHKNLETSNFKSDFSQTMNQTWLGKDYWANPLQDWQIANGRVECIVSQENRNIHLLTRQLSKKKGAFEMRVQLGFFNTEQSNSNKNWAGFSIGSRGQFSSYKDSAVFGKGLNIGISTGGTLFIGESGPNHKNQIIIDKLVNGLELSVIIKPINNEYSIDCILRDLETNTVLSRISKNNVAPEQLIGDLVLVSNFEESSRNKQNVKKSAWFKDWKIRGEKVSKHNNRSYGPIMFSQYTLSRNTLKLTAQLAPVNITKNNQVQLQIQENNSWKTILTTSIDKEARTARFKIKDWNDAKDTPYRVSYQVENSGALTENYWEGTIRKNPKDKEEIVVAGFTGNNDLGFPNTDIVNQIKYHDPDLLFFSGDQIYEEVGGYNIQREPYDMATLDYLRKWYIYGWAYRDILKNRPTVVLVDDHDVYMGNIWGESGKATIKDGTRKEIQDSGGYRMSPDWVNMVGKTQTSHLPDPYDPNPVQRDIGVYYTQMNYGGISYAILEDRKFKSALKALLPDAKIDNGWPLNKSFDVMDADVKEAHLLGERQLRFLEKWTADWSFEAEMKTVLSQTIFANVATLPKEAMTDAIVPTLRILNKGEYPENDFPVTDFDSNGWPQTGRNNAIETIRKGFSFHLAGDQHLGSTIQYGTDEFGDSGYAFCVPSISNYWPRRWYPINGGANRKEDSPKYTGDFKDGFGNKFSVKAISNPLYTNKKQPELNDRAAGYGIVRFNKNNRTVKIECWPRDASPEKGDSQQYLGWPITINQEDNYGKKAFSYLPKLRVQDAINPVVQIIDENGDQIIYTIRIRGNTFTPKVFKSGLYTIKVSDPDKGLMKEFNHIDSEKFQNQELTVYLN